MTLLSRDHFETAYAVLCHFHLIAQRAPVIFSQVSRVIIYDGVDKHTDIVKLLEPAHRLWKVTVSNMVPPPSSFPLYLTPLSPLPPPPSFLSDLFSLG